MLGPLQQLTSLLVMQESASDPSSCLQSPMAPLVIMLPILYFLWIRPASKERKTHQAMLESLKRGDEIVTQSGIIGRIADMDAKTMKIEVAKNVKIEVLRSSVSRRADDLRKKADEGKKDDSSEGKASKS